MTGTEQQMMAQAEAATARGAAPGGVTPGPFLLTSRRVRGILRLWRVSAQRTGAGAIDEASSGAVRARRLLVGGGPGRRVGRLLQDLPSVGLGYVRRSCAGACRCARRR